jgi:hypothetical protein
VGSVSCQLWLDNSNTEFNPVGSCDNPPFNDECIGAIVDVSCNENYTNIPATAGWDNQRFECGGATEGGSCEDGTCFPDIGDPLCIWQEGGHDCPAPFGDRTLFYRDFDDTRTCSDCSCSPTGQACTIEVEICSVGFYDLTLQSGEDCEDLNSSDGDGVSLLLSSVDSSGSCPTDVGAGVLSGAVVETDPVTVCCL